MSRSRRILPAVVTAAVALALLTAAPAYAASPGATPTLTITPDNAITETPSLTFSGGCPTGSDGVSIETPAGSLIAPTLDASFDYLASGYYARNWGVPGDALAFTVTCSTAGVDSPSTIESFTIPDLGSSVVASTPIALSSPLWAVGTCGTAPSVIAVVFRYYYDGGAVLSPSDYRADDGGAFTFTDLQTPAGIGFAVGDVGRIQALCTSDLGGGLTATYTVALSNTFTVVADDDYASLTATIVDPANEDSDLDFAGECGPVADHAELHYDGPSDSGYYYENFDSGTTFMATETASQFGEPGDEVDFWTRCMDGTTEVGVSAPPVTLTLPDNGSSLTMASTFTTAQRLTLSGTCGTSGATQVLVVFGTFDEGVVDGVVRPITGDTYSFTDMPTPAELGLGAVSNGFAQVLCFRAGDVDELDPVSARLAEFTVTVPAKTLSATGVDATAPLALGGLLLGAGALLLLVRRVRVR